MEIPLKLSKYEAVGFEKDCGISEMFHFRYQWDSETQNQCATRRIPCLCDACLANLSKKWIVGTPAVDQPCFADPDAASCYFEPMMQGMNKWRIITLVPKDGEHEVDEINEVLQSALDYKASQCSEMIDPGKFGIVGVAGNDAKDGALLVKWTGLPFSLQEETFISGCKLPIWRQEPRWWRALFIHT